MTLGEIAEVNPEKTPKWAHDHLIRYVDIASVTWGVRLDPNIDQQEFGKAPGRARRLIRSKDVLVSTVRPYLRAMTVVPNELGGEVASTGFAVLRARPGIALPGYVWACVSHAKFTEEMIRKSTGSNYPAVRANDVESYKVSVPPLNEQRRIVDLIGSVDSAIEAADPQLVWFAYQQVLASWMQAPGRPLGDAVGASTVREKVDSDRNYRILGVLRSGKGLTGGEVKSGKDVSYGHLLHVGPNQLVYRKLTAWEGPITVTAETEPGGWVSGEFPVFNIDGDVLLPGMLRHACRWPGLWHRIGQRLVGTVQRRKRLNPEALLQIQVPMPSLEEQRTALEVLDAVYALHEGRVELTKRLHNLRANLLTALLSGEHEIPGSYDELMEEATV